MATNTDSNLRNPWGLTRSATSPWWIANNGTGTSTVYDGKGNLIPIANQPFISVPPPANGSGPSTPTGTVFNGTTDFEVAAGKHFAPNPAGLLHNSIVRQEMLHLRNETVNTKSLLAEIIHSGNPYSKINYYYQ